LIAVIFTLSACSKENKNHVHKYGKWTTVKAATCTTKGTQEQACSCGDKKTKDIELISHDFSDATCTAPKTCRMCGVTEGQALGHTYNPSSNCEDVICSICNEMVKSHEFEVISAGTPSLISSSEQIEQCVNCGEKKTSTLAPVEPQTLGMPIIYIEDIDATSIPLYDLEKPDGEITVKYKYVSNSSDIESFECFCEIKVQGASSQYYPKKNFTVKFFEDENLSDKLKVDLGWGKQTKYCMKANYIDSSHARNIVAANLFAEVIQTRKNINPGLTNAPNYGVVDGYPVAVYLNGEFHGLYTMNIPKDDWTFNMKGGEDTREALFMADHWSESVRLREEIGEPYSDYEWEVEHCSTLDDSWIRESFNKLIRLLNCGDNEKIKQELPNHLDIEAAIDNMLFTYAISAGDNIAKNVLWATFDGEVWIPSMYDMDGTFGIIWDGQPWGGDVNPLYPKITEGGEIKVANARLYEVLISCYADEVEARWKELRASVLTVENISKKFDEFFEKIPDVVYSSELEKWTEIPYATTNYTNMYKAVEMQFIRLDDFFDTFNQ